jgi:hypothetical protein
MDKIESAPLDALFQAFLDSKKKSTAETYRSSFALWVNFTKMNGQASLDFKKKDTDAKTEKLVMAFQKHLLKIGKSENTAKTLCGAIRGFYTDNRLGLQFTKSEAKNLSEANRNTTDYLFTKEDLAKMCEVANLEESYIVKVGKSLGIRASDMISLSYSTFRGIHLDGEAPIALGEIVTQKEKVKAFPFLDSDAVKVVKLMLEANPTAKDSERVLKLSEQSLSIALQRLVRKAHIETGSKIVRFHNLRRYLFDKLSCVMSDEKAKQIIGKSVPESAYLSTESLRECYLRAMPSIVLNGNGKALVKVEQLEQALAQSESERLATQTRLEQALKRIDEVTGALARRELTREKQENKFDNDINIAHGLDLDPDSAILRNFIKQTEKKVKEE